MTSTIAFVQPRTTLKPQMVRSVNLTGAAGRLEATLNEGLEEAPFSALVCHPHPLGGGTMHNKVVFHAMKALNAPEWGLCWPVLRFNFRGVGLSRGLHDGEAESGDVLAAIDWLVNAYSRPVVVAGFSFGAAMALKACCSQGKDDSGCRASVRALALIGLPTRAGAQDYSYPSLSSCTIPKLFLSGDRDQYAPAAQWRQVAASAAEPKRAVAIAGADHFFEGQLEQMQQALAGWLKEQMS
jgi:alpha/beta superfamily hydrolase